MNSQDLYTVLFDWADSIIVGEVPVIRSYQNDAPPAGTYIVIEDSVSWTPQGDRTVGVGNGVTRLIGYDYEVRIALWECRGRGDTLRTLVENVGTRDTRELFAKNGLSVMRVGAILQVPDLLDKTRWHMQHKCEITLGAFRAVAESVTTIGSVEVVGDVENVHVEQTIQV